MYSFIEFHNDKEHSLILLEVNSVLEELVKNEKNIALQEIFSTIGKAVGGIAQSMGQAAQYKADVQGAYEGGKYGSVKKAVDSLKELDEILKELGYDENTLQVLQTLRTRLEAPQQAPAGA